MFNSIVSPVFPQFGPFVRVQYEEERERERRGGSVRGCARERGRDAEWWSARKIDRGVVALANIRESVLQTETRIPRTRSERSNRQVSKRKEIRIEKIRARGI